MDDQPQWHTPSIVCHLGSSCLSCASSDSRKHSLYLCFQQGQKRYWYRVLPFGLSSAPWPFDRVVKQVNLFVRTRGLSLFQYLDDWLNLQVSQRQAVRDIRFLLSLCSSPGLLVKEQKSELVPVQSIVFLGERRNLVVDPQCVIASSDQVKERVCANCCQL